MNEVIREFLLETHENLAQLDLDLVTLETDPTERETLARVFRTLHTIKGTAGFLGFMKLQTIGHAAETLLSRLTANELRFEPTIATALLATVDAVRQILEVVEKTEEEGDGDFVELIKQLEQLKATDTSKPTAPSRTTPPQPVPQPSPAPLNRPELPIPPDEHPSILTEDQPIPRRPERASPPVESPPVLARGRAGSAHVNGTGPLPASAPPQRRSSETIIVAESPLADANEPRSPAVTDSSIRVDVGLLDKLMALVGELVLTRNQITEYSSVIEDPGFLNTVQRLNVLTSELQAGVTKTRMQAIGNTWSKYPRLVRDLALACGKSVRFDMEGRDTELDKTIVEAIRDPLTHMIRNAVDHGIEPPAVRKARGKPEDGRLSLRAFHDGGKVVIEVADDGGGIDLARVRAKAINAELISPEQADEMTERALLNLIFLPGFTTADRVTHFSGRGVGMDVVRSNVEKIGGTVDIESWAGRGASIKIKIPRTLAIIPALIVSCGGDSYAIPQISLLELIRLEGEHALNGIEYVGEAPVYRLRGNLLPIVYLDQLLQVEAPRRRTDDNEAINIVILQADDRPFGLVVDEIHDTAEIVVKPLQQRLKGIGGFAGATIMGDGAVALILDVIGLAVLANIVSTVRERDFRDKSAIARKALEERMTLLLFRGPDDRRVAIPLSQVGRIEEFPTLSLERVGHQHAVLYRDEILPVINVAEVLESAHVGRGGASRARVEDSEETVVEDSFQFVVHGTEKRQVGLIIGRILDIVEASLSTRARVNHPCVLFTLVIQGRVTEVLDVEGLVRLADPEFYQ